MTYTTEAAARKLGITREHFNRRFLAGDRVFTTGTEIYRVSREPDPDRAGAYRYTLLSFTAQQRLVEAAFADYLAQDSRMAQLEQQMRNLEHNLDIACQRLTAAECELNPFSASTPRAPNPVYGDEEPF